MFKYKEPIIAKITLRKKWVQAIEKIDSLEKRSHLLMIIFDGYASFIMSNGAGDVRAYIKSKIGNIDLDAVIVAFRKFAVKHKLLNSLHRFHVFRDQLLRFSTNFFNHKLHSPQPSRPHSTAV